MRDDLPLDLAPLVAIGSTARRRGGEAASPAPIARVRAYERIASIRTTNDELRRDMNGPVGYLGSGDEFPSVGKIVSQGSPHRLGPPTRGALAALRRGTDVSPTVVPAQDIVGADTEFMMEGISSKPSIQMIFTPSSPNNDS